MSSPALWTIEHHQEGWEVYMLNRIVTHSLESQEDALEAIRRRSDLPTVVQVVELDGYRHSLRVV